MTSDERNDSLADQAAAWIPPWARNTDPAESPATPADAISTASVSEPEVDAPPEVDTRLETGEADGPAVAEPATAVGDAGDGLTAGEAGRPEAPAVPTEAPAVPTEVAARWDEKPVELDEADLHGALEAILLVVDEPASEQVLAQVLDRPVDRVRVALRALAGEYTRAGRGFELRRAAGGWRLYTRPEYASYVERFVLDGQSVRLTQAALEALAVVAYKQPVTRSRLSAIRGVNCDGVIRTLLTRGLVQECGIEPDSGAHLYQTTTLFLEKLGIDSVHELPPLAPFLPDDVEEIADASR